MFITAVEPGSKLAAPIVREDGYVILAEGAVLTAVHIERLRRMNICFVEIEIPPLPAEEADADISTPAGFANLYHDTMIDVKTAFAAMRYFCELPLCEMQELAEARVIPLMEAKGVISHLQAVRRQDDYTYYHSINVAVISGILGKWMGYSGEALKDLVLAGLLHDVGKSQVPLDVLNKPAKLTEPEMGLMKQHTTQGYAMMKKCGHVAEGVLRGVLEHHERIDGSGYPNNLRADKIHPFAKIVAVADIYDAMTSDRVYQKKRTPFSVVEELNSAMFNKLDPETCSVFLNNVKDYFAGSLVRLSDGREAEVVYLGRTAASRPVVRTIYGEFIDLDVNQHIAIEGLA